MGHGEARRGGNSDLNCNIPRRFHRNNLNDAISIYNELTENDYDPLSVDEFQKIQELAPQWEQNPMSGLPPEYGIKFHYAHIIIIGRNSGNRGNNNYKIIDLKNIHSMAKAITTEW